MFAGKRRITLVVMGVAVLSALLAIPFVAGAITPSFSDVPTSHPFFSEIESIKTGGITQGSTECGPIVSPAYCPDSSVRRDAMAAFMERGFTRVEGGSGGDVLANDTAAVTVASAVVEAGATGAGTNGYVLATITGVAFADANCPCVLLLGIKNGGGVVGYTVTLVTPTAIGEYSYQAVIPLAGDTSDTYNLIAGVLDVDTTLPETAKVTGQITAVYVPFDGDANNNSTGMSSLSSSSGMNLLEFAESEGSDILDAVVEMRDRLMTP